MKSIIGIFLVLAGCGRQPAPQIVAYGDSHTQGLSGDVKDQGYVRRLSEALAIPYSDRAIGGSRLAEVGQLASISRDANELENDSSIIVLLVGFNDMRWGLDPGFPLFRAQLREALSLLSKRHVNRRHILVGNCMRMRPEEYTNPIHQGFVHGSDAAAQEINKVIAEEVARAGVVLVDAYSVIDPNEDTSSDRVHLSAAGYEKLTQAFQLAL